MRTMTMLSLLVVLAGATIARAARYEIVADGSEIVFESKAPLDTFEGRTNAVAGHFTIDEQALTGPVELSIEVQLATFDTGIGKRNRHMRENHLETRSFPVATFIAGEVLTAEPDRLALGTTTHLTLRGALNLHGMVRSLECDVEVRPESDGSLHIEGGFPVLLSEHGIERPRFLVMKLADEQKVRFALTARAVSEGVEQ